MKTFVIDGNNFSDWTGFTKELYEQFGADWEPFGLNWLDDILYGSVVGFEEEDEVTIFWKNNLKSKHDLDKDTSVILNQDDKGLYQVIVDMLQKHDNIHLRLESDDKSHVRSVQK